MKTKICPFELDRRAKGVNRILAHIQMNTTHPAFFHQYGLHGAVIVDHAMQVWWNDPIRGLIPMSNAANRTQIGTDAFRGLLRYLWWHLRDGLVLQRQHFPNHDDLGISKLEWEGLLTLAQTNGVVAA